MKKILQIVGVIVFIGIVLWIYIGQENRIIDADKKYKETEKENKVLNEIIKDDEEKFKKIYESIE